MSLAQEIDELVNGLRRRKDSVFRVWLLVTNDWAGEARQCGSRIYKILDY